LLAGRRWSPTGPAIDTDISLAGRGVLGQAAGSPPRELFLLLGPSLLENGIVVTKASAGARGSSESGAFTKSMH